MPAIAGRLLPDAHGDFRSGKIFLQQCGLAVTMPYPADPVLGLPGGMGYRIGEDSLGGAFVPGLDHVAGALPEKLRQDGQVFLKN